MLAHAELQCASALVCVFEWGVCSCSVCIECVCACVGIVCWNCVLELSAVCMLRCVQGGGVCKALPHF